jgi:UDP-GlcNAc3NAcA epimerase
MEIETSAPPVVLNIGDVMYDAMLMSLEIAESKSAIFQTLALTARTSRYCLATVHRAENTDDLDRLDAIVSALVGICGEMPVIWPVHPRTRKVLDARYPALAATEGARIIEPVGYFDMLMLEKHAAIILTDSGGIQKEAYWMQVPCITLRDETEWVETVRSGCNTLAPVKEKNILDIFHSVLDKRGDYQGRPYGDGNASGKLVSLIEKYV